MPDLGHRLLHVTCGVQSLGVQRRQPKGLGHKVISRIWCGEWWPSSSYGHARGCLTMAWQPPYIIHTSDIYFVHLNHMSSSGLRGPRLWSAISYYSPPQNTQSLPTHHCRRMLKLIL